jgi:protocatechuate 3,4-dioxygenase alpha subunit
MADTPPGHTASQTVGPFLHIALADPAARFAVADGADGAIVVRGRLTDGNGDPIPDGLIETWQVDGRFARSATDGDGVWEIHTTKPPPAPTRDGTAQAPHLVMSVFARGLLDRVVTRVYFGDEEDTNATDP